MPLIEWTDQLSIGNSLIDKQHQKLISIINRLHDARMEGKGQETLAAVLDELAAYTQYHFTAEEDLMRRSGYPDLEKHAEIHRELIQQLKQLQESHKKGEEALSTKVFVFLVKWLTEHIMGKDKKIAPYVNRRPSP